MHFLLTQYSYLPRKDVAVYHHRLIFSVVTVQYILLTITNCMS